MSETNNACGMLHGQSARVRAVLISNLKPHGYIEELMESKDIVAQVQGERGFGRPACRHAGRYGRHQLRLRQSRQTAQARRELSPVHAPRRAPELGNMHHFGVAQYRIMHTPRPHAGFACGPNPAAGAHVLCRLHLCLPVPAVGALAYTWTSRSTIISSGVKVRACGPTSLCAASTNWCRPTV